MTNSLLNHLLGSGLWVTLGKVVSVVCAVVLNIVLTHALSPSEYGSYYVAVSSIVILATFGNIGMDQVVIRFAGMHQAFGRKKEAGLAILVCLAMSVASAILVALCVFVFGAHLTATMLNAPLLSQSILILSAWVFMATVQRQMAESFRGINDIKLATAFGGVRNNGIVTSFLNVVIIGVVWVVGGLSLRDALMIALIVSAVTILFACNALKHFLSDFFVARKKISCISTWSCLKSAICEGWPLWLGGLLAVLRFQGIAWFAAAFDSASQVALLGVALRLVSLLMAPIILIKSILPPVIVKLHAENDTLGMEKVIRGMCGIVSVPCYAILILFILCGSWLISKIFGDYYSAAYPILMLLCAGLSINIFCGGWQIVLPMTGKRNTFLVVNTLAAMLQFVACIVGGAMYGVLGVAIGACFGEVVFNIFGLVITRYQVGIWTHIRINRASMIIFANSVRRKFVRT